jgi:hypothetical protein
LIGRLFYSKFKRIAPNHSDPNSTVFIGWTDSSELKVEVMKGFLLQAICLLKHESLLCFRFASFGSLDLIVSLQALNMRIWIVARLKVKMMWEKERQIAVGLAHSLLSTTKRLLLWNASQSSSIQTYLCVCVDYRITPNFFWFSFKGLILFLCVILKCFYIIDVLHHYISNLDCSNFQFAFL